jgi:hypothetical protein
MGIDGMAFYYFPPTRTCVVVGETLPAVSLDEPCSPRMEKKASPIVGKALTYSDE